jgi:hypothetical protein
VYSLHPSWQQACPRNARDALSSIDTRISASHHSFMQQHVSAKLPVIITLPNGTCKAISPALTHCSACKQAPGIREQGLLGSPAWPPMVHPDSAKP